MADIFTKEKRSAMMSAVKCKGSKIESTVSAYLKQLGLRFPAHPKNLFGNPDFANKKRKIVIFVDSCF